jgi:hypothetical protein
MELAINIDYSIYTKQQLAISNCAPTWAKIKRVPIPCVGVVGVADRVRRRVRPGHAELRRHRACATRGDVDDVRCGSFASFPPSRRVRFAPRADTFGQCPRL